MPGLHDRLRHDLRTALRESDREAVRVLRTALSAIANAEAQPNLDEVPRSPLSEGRIAGAAAGVGASEVMRRTLDDAEMRSILAAERRECLSSAEILETGGGHAQAASLRADAALLERYLRS